MGIAIYKLKKSQISTVNSNPTLKDCYVKFEDIAFILTQMPPNTSIAHIKTSPIVGLYIEFEIGLYNEIFKDDVEIVDNSSYMRDIGFTNSGDMIQYDRNTDFNLKDVVRSYEDIKAMQELESCEKCGGTGYWTAHFPYGDEEIPCHEDKCIERRKKS